MSIALAVLTLIVPVALGALAGAIQLLRDDAIDPLNRYALYIAFPLLVARGIGDTVLPRQPLFWLAVPIVLVASLMVVAIGAPLAGLRKERGTLALTLAFGNVAYLGLPVVEQVLGPSAIGLASLLVALHVACGMLVGPYLLLRWSGRSEDSGSIGRALRQPLLYAPLAGILVRALPPSAREITITVIEPLGRTASPVALFLLGLYLWVHRDELRRIGGADIAHAFAKLVLLPALTFALVWPALRVGWMTSPQAQVLFLLSAMPAAVTTFALGRDLGVGAARLSQGVVVSSVASALTLPAAIWLLRLL